MLCKGVCKEVLRERKGAKRKRKVRAANSLLGARYLTVDEPARTRCGKLHCPIARSHQTDRSTLPAKTGVSCTYPALRWKPTSCSSRVYVYLANTAYGEILGGDTTHFERTAPRQHSPPYKFQRRRWTDLSSRLDSAHFCFKHFPQMFS
jgi:hypothetical protein